jgi:hypothetical protein
MLLNVSPQSSSNAASSPRWLDNADSAQAATLSKSFFVLSITSGTPEAWEAEGDSFLLWTDTIWWEYSSKKLESTETSRALENSRHCERIRVRSLRSMAADRGASPEALEMALSRLQKLASHLDAEPVSAKALLSAEPTASRLSAKHNQLKAEKLQAFMAGSYKADKERIYDFFKKHPELQTPVEISKAEHRELAFKQMQALVHEVGLKPLTYLMTDPAKYYNVFEAIGTIDLSLSIKMGVQYSLWGGSVVNLGTQKHKDKYAVAIENLEAPGCFAMTELHHGRIANPLFKVEASCFLNEMSCSVLTSFNQVLITFNRVSLYFSSEALSGRTARSLEKVLNIYFQARNGAPVYNSW